MSDNLRDDAVLAELVAREPLFHRHEWGTARADFEAMTAEDYWEVGASGSVYEREHIWSVLQERYADPGRPDPWECSDFRCRRLSEDTYLLTYALRQGERLSRRTTVWQRGPHGWRALYHQGTLAA